MHINLKLSSCVIVLFLSTVSFGQRTLTASEAVFIALENNYQIQISEKQHEINERNNRWSEAGAFPTVTLNVAQNNTIQDNTNNPFTFTPGIILNQSISPSLNLDWNIFSGFQVRMSKQRLEQLEEQSSNNVIAVIEATIQDVLKAYYTSQLQKDRMAFFQDILNLSRERFQYYEIKEKYSGSTSLELMQFKNQYLTDSTNFLMQEISFKNSLRNLQLLMNDPSEEPIDYVLTDKIDIVLADINYETALDEMLANNANLRNQFIGLEMQKTNTAFRRSFLYPTLSFSAGVNPSWSWVREIKDNAFEAETNGLVYYGNLNLRYTIFNNWKNKRAIEVSQIQEDISTLNIESMKSTLTSTLRNLIELYELRLQLVSISQENLVYAEKVYELAAIRFDNGTINSIELTSVQNTYQNTLIRHYENLFNKMDTFLEIYKMTGKISLEYQ
ncbi:MAG: TolC family protein [Crocinitomicaceae bacterium]|nr:TolC family protein [Crocinitomicaceae bacterium]